MNGLSKLLLLSWTVPVAFGQSPAPALSLRASQDVLLSVDPKDPFWKDAPVFYVELDPFGKPLAGHKTEVRSRWTPNNLYLLYTCPYEELFLKPNPETARETNQLWDWDVAEAFLGSDFNSIQQYKEFEVSPQGEWVDLDIDRKNPRRQGGITWNSAFKAAARIDDAKKIWYAAMEIPWSSIDTRPAKDGLEMRANFYRIERQPPDRMLITWRPTQAKSFHVPEAFGILRLVEKVNQ
jgi:hypothetical protein